jgi:predicted ATPase/DNA-binding SARP family transcriptional activator
MSTLKLYLLGPPRVEVESRPVEIKRRKALALLVYLVVTGRLHLRPALAGLLWGDMPETVAMTNLRKALANLRKLVGLHLDITRQAVAFNRDNAYWLDVEQFEANAGDVSNERAIKKLHEAVDLYQGDYLDGFYVRNAPNFEAWVLTQRTRLRALAVEGLHTLAHYHTERGEAERALAINYTTRLLALEPWREEAHRQMMLLLALGGQRSAALTQYQTCRRVLDEELGVEPSEETIELYEHIRDGKSAHNLPVQLTPILGRETELAELTKLLTDPEIHLVTIIGPGGIGKTRLALAAAADQLDNPGLSGDYRAGHLWSLVAGFKHGIYFVPLAPLDSPDSIATTVAETLNLPVSSGSNLQQRLIDYLRPKQMLLVLDNFEHLLEGVGLVIELLRAAPGLKILATSRARLQVQGEQLFPLGGIDVPHRAEEVSAEAIQSSAVQLFLQSARRLVPDFAATTDNIQAVIQICRLLEGMPLAILLAAAWVEVLTPAEIVAEISQGFDFLVNQLQNVEERQQSLRAVFDHSWRLLTGPERTIFAQLSVFRGGLTREAAEVVTRASLRDLMALVNKSLLQHTPAGRYEVHELLRQYAAEKLTGQTPTAQTSKVFKTFEVSDVRDRHSAYYTTFLQQREADLQGARQQVALAEIKVDEGNVQAAWNWAVEQGQIERLDRSIETLALFYKRRGRTQEGEAAYQLAVEKLSTMKSGDGLRVLAKTLAWQATLSRKSGLIEPAGQMLAQSLELLTSPELAGRDTRPERAFVLREMGLITASYNHEKARLFYEQSLPLYQALGDQWGTARVLDVLAWTFEHAGDGDTAKLLQEESLVLRRTLGDQKGMANSLYELAHNAAFCQGQYEEAERLARECLTILQDIGDRASLAWGVHFLGDILVHVGKFAEGRSLLEDGLSILEDLSLHSATVRSNIMLGKAKSHLGQYEQARAQLQLGLTHAREIDDQAYISIARAYLGEVLVAEKAYAQALALLQENATGWRKIGRHVNLVGDLSRLGYAARGLGHMAEARHYLSEALRVATEIRAWGTLYFTLPALALLLADRGEPERAVELYALASHRYPFVANSRWFEDVVGQHIAAVTAALPPEMVTAERGKARDLWVTAEALLVEMEGWG